MGARTLTVNGWRLRGAATAMGRYIQVLAQQWSRMETPFSRVRILSPTPAEVGPLGDATPVDVEVVGEGWPGLAWEQGVLPAAARGSAVLYCPAYTGPVLYPGRMVVSNHGIYNGVSGEFSWWQRLRSTPVNRLSARRADHTIANSEATRQDLIDHLGAPSGSLSVIYPAAHETFFQERTPKEVDPVVEAIWPDRPPYVLFVGKLARRRHVPELIEAFARVKTEEGLPHRLLVVGPNTSELPMDELVAEAGGEDVVVYVPHAETETLAALYAGADLYALPTTYEGISWTMFEAMASGAPVLTVEHPQLSEGGGDAVLAVSTPSVDDLADGLRQMLLDPDLRARYAEAGRRRAARFSWGHHARRALEILDAVARPTDR